MAAWRRKGGLEKFEQRLVDGMAARGYAEAFARQIYQQILGFGEYGFPESHSASFALLVYVSAWLKRYEPAAFTGALLNSLPMGFYAPAQLVQRCAPAWRRGAAGRRDGERVGLHAGEKSDADGDARIPRCGSAFAWSPDSRKPVRNGSSMRGESRRSRAAPISRIARRSTGAISRASPRPTRSQRSPAIATARRGTSPASSGCRRCSSGSTFAEADPELPPPTEGQDIVADYRALSPHAAPASAFAAARQAASSGGSPRRPRSRRRRTAASSAPRASSSAGSVPTPRAA